MRKSFTAILIIFIALMTYSLGGVIYLLSVYNEKTSINKFDQGSTWVILIGLTSIILFFIWLLIDQIKDNRLISKQLKEEEEQIIRVVK